MKNILNVMNSFFCKEYGKEKKNYYTLTEKREVEAYNLGNRLAERSCKNRGAKLLLEQVLIVNGYYELHMKNILKVMNSFFCKEYGKEETNYSEPTEKRKIEAYNLGNILAERSCKNIRAKLLSEHTNWYCSLR